MITGMKQLKRTMQKLPLEVQSEVRRAVVKNVLEGVKVARTLAPDVSGETKSKIFSQFDLDGLTGSIEAAPADKASQIKQKAIEFGRKEGDKGATDPQPYIQPTYQYLAKRFRGRISRAIGKGVRAAGG